MLGKEDGSLGRCAQIRYETSMGIKEFKQCFLIFSYRIHFSVVF